jgi:hypothetical protein
MYFLAFGMSMNDGTVLRKAILLHVGPYVRVPSLAGSDPSSQSDGWRSS